MTRSRAHLAQVFRSFLVLLFGSAALQAQMLPAGATPRGVVYAFLSRTATSADSIDRASFATRLTGALEGVDPERFRGMIPPGSRIRIDSIPDIGTTGEGFREVVAYTTIESAAGKEDLYFFCAGDSIWRIESIGRFPSPAERARIVKSLAETDTLDPSYRTLHGDLGRLLLPDDSLRSLARRNLSALNVLATRLAAAAQWERFSIREVEFDKLDEYRELDDDIRAEELIFYTLDRRALEHVKQELGIRRIERDRSHPGILILVAGEIESGSYGYISAASAELLPPLAKDGYLTLKPAAKGWWLYRRVEGGR